MNNLDDGCGRFRISNLQQIDYYMNQLGNV